MALLIATWPTATARGHAGLIASSPKKGAELRSAPKRLVLTFGETPTKEGKVVVQDGCGRDVAAELSVQGKTITTTTIGSAQPGKWRIDYRVVSAEDGHPVSGGFRLSVTGKPDCSVTDGPSPKEEDPDAGGETTDDDSAPWALIGLVTAGLAAAAIALRWITSR